MAAGQIIEISITVKNISDVHGLGAYHIGIDFDPKGIRVDEVLGGDKPFDTVIPNISDGTGRIEIASFHTQIPGPTGDIKVARLSITALSSGNWPLVITIFPGELINTDGVNISASVINGSIYVTQ